MAAGGVVMAHNGDGEDYQLEGQTKGQHNSTNGVGALWRQEGKSGEYWSGVIMGKRVVVFHNTRKMSEKSPDLRVLLSREQEQQPF